MTRIRTILTSARGRIVTLTAAAIIVVGLGIGTTSASAAGQITSGGIANQTIRSWDIATDGVGKAEVRPNAAGPSEIANDAVSSDEIQDGTVTENDLSAGVKQQLRGDKGDSGNDGANGVSGYEVAAKEVTVPAGAANQTVTIACPEGKIATGGGYHAEGRGGPEVVAHESAPSGLVKNDDGSWSASGWTVRASNASTQAAQVQAYVLCASVA